MADELKEEDYSAKCIEQGFYLSVLVNGTPKPLFCIDTQYTISTKYDEEFTVEVGMLPDLLTTDDELDFVVSVEIDGQPVQSGYTTLSRTSPKLTFRGFEQPDGKLKAFKFCTTTKGEGKSNSEARFGTIRANIFEYTRVEGEPDKKFLDSNKDTAVKCDDKKKADVVVGQGNEVGTIAYTNVIKLGYLRTSIDIWYNLFTPANNAEDEESD